MLKFCDSSFNIVHIHRNGEVSPCLCRAWHSYGPVGNLNQNSLREIFNGQKMTEFRKSIFDQTFVYCNKETCGKMWNLDHVPNFDDMEFPKLPTIVYLQDLDYSCNLKCPSCRLVPIYSRAIDPQTKRILDTIKDAYRDSEQTVMVSGDGSGEMFASQAYLDFFNSEDLPACIKLAINTNGNLLLKRMHLIDKLHEKNQITAIAICFDAATAKTYKSIRGARLDIVLEGAKEVIKRGIPVTAQMVVQYQNYREIPAYHDMCRSLGVHFMGLQKLNRWMHMSDTWWNANSVENHPDIDYDFLVSALEEFKKEPNAGICGGLETIIAQKKLHRVSYSDKGYDNWKNASSCSLAK